LSPALHKNARPYLENNKEKRPGDVAEVVECLPSKCKALTSKPVQKKYLLPEIFTLILGQFGAKVLERESYVMYWADRYSIRSKSLKTVALLKRTEITSSFLCGMYSRYTWPCYNLLVNIVTKYQLSLHG
jgi:hypothetical protein